MNNIIYIEYYNQINFRVWANDGIEQELNQFFSFQVPGYKWMPAYKSGRWDGYIRLYSVVKKSLYVGLYDYLVKFAEDNNYELKLFEGSKPIVSRCNVSLKEITEYCTELNVSVKGEVIIPYDYQIEAVQYGLHNKRAVMLSPTASGKSLIIYCMMRWLIDHGQKIVLIVPSTSLVEQLYSDFKDYSTVNGWNVEDHVHQLYSGKDKSFNKMVLLTTWQSLYTDKKSNFDRKFFDQFGAVLVDETHGLAATAISSVIEKIYNAEWRVGVTGTLQNEQCHALQVQGLMGKAYQVTTTKKLMDANKVSKLKIECHICQYPMEVKKQLYGLDYDAEANYIVSNTRRNMYIATQALRASGNTLVLFQWVEKHGKPLHDLVNKYNKSGKRVYLIYGEMAVEERERIRKELETVDDAIIIASYQIFSTGINVPSIENIIFTSPTKSKIRVLQSIGRGLRLKDGKEYCTLIDLSDDFTYRNKKNITMVHLLERLKLYSIEKFNFTMKKVDLYPPVK